MFGRKLEISLESTMGGSKVTHEPRGMPYGLASVVASGPFVPSDGEVRTIGEVGTIEQRQLPAGAFEATRLATRAANPDRGSNSSLDRRLAVDRRLAKLGIPGRR